ncbi:hypothetical protein ARMSODRAFT_983700 [Armillaria solidipes]|uniref:Uncharacterized protein n=1 Tax=Armillaria solidipes TaxID=1076256 RepID=A0A2H3AI64_9AGAR|nr:hypothetical protein ARMSODRAFT_983700 [Armillaria solidipes]
MSGPARLFVHWTYYSCEEIEPVLLHKLIGNLYSAETAVSCSGMWFKLIKQGLAVVDMNLRPSFSLHSHYIPPRCLLLSLSPRDDLTMIPSDIIMMASFKRWQSHACLPVLALVVMYGFNSPSAYILHIQSTILVVPPGAHGELMNSQFCLESGLDFIKGDL